MRKSQPTAMASQPKAYPGKEIADVSKKKDQQLGEIPNQKQLWAAEEELEVQDQRENQTEEGLVEEQSGQIHEEKLFVLEMDQG